MSKRFLPSGTLQKVILLVCLVGAHFIPNVSALELGEGYQCLRLLGLSDPELSIKTKIEFSEHLEATNGYDTFFVEKAVRKALRIAEEAGLEIPEQLKIYFSHSDPMSSSVEVFSGELQLAVNRLDSVPDVSESTIIHEVFHFIYEYTLAKVDPRVYELHVNPEITEEMREELRKDHLGYLALHFRMSELFSDLAGEAFPVSSRQGSITWQEHVRDGVLYYGMESAGSGITPRYYNSRKSIEALIKEWNSTKNSVRYNVHNAMTPSGVYFWRILKEMSSEQERALFFKKLISAIFFTISELEEHPDLGYPADQHNLEAVDLFEEWPFLFNQKGRPAIRPGDLNKLLIHHYERL